MLNVKFIKMQKLTMFITASCLCFIFDQAWTWLQSPVMKKQLSMTDNSCDNCFIFSHKKRRKLPGVSSAVSSLLTRLTWRWLYDDDIFLVIDLFAINYMYQFHQFLLLSITCHRTVESSLPSLELTSWLRNLKHVEMQDFFPKKIYTIYCKKLTTSSQ